MKNRVISILLVLCMMLSLLPNWVFATESVGTPNQNLLTAILQGERHWVVETLVEDSREHNPMAVAQHAAGEKSLAQDALDNYRGIDENGKNNRAAYRTLVKAIDLLRK